MQGFEYLNISNVRDHFTNVRNWPKFVFENLCCFKAVTMDRGHNWSVTERNSDTAFCIVGSIKQRVFVNSQNNRCLIPSVVSVQVLRHLLPEPAPAQSADV